MADPKSNQLIERLTKTKIVCTLGPASTSPDVLEKMIRAGMDVVRLNFSHGEHSEHEKLFNTVRELSAKYNHQVSIMCDIQGPKIRTGLMEKPFQVAVGDVIEVTSAEFKGTKEKIQIKYKTLMEDLKEKDLIFINDGIVKLVVTKKNQDSLTCVVESGGQISDHKGVNIPSGNLSVDIVTNKDKRDLEFIAKLDPEFVASSFVGSGADVKKVREYLKSFGNTNIKIISKVERPSALQNLDEVIEESDAIMVARGDLGVEIDTWEVPFWQKEMCRKCNAAGKPVIVATQMLESMTGAARPTRAEANDVFNAVLDGADAVMLSGETSVGKYPVEAVRIMDKIAQAAESQLPKRELSLSKYPGMTETVAAGVYAMSGMFPTCGWEGKIITVAGPPSGYVTRMVSKYRPPLDIIAITDDLRTTRELTLVWGVRSLYDEGLKSLTDMEERNAQATKKALSMNLINEENKIILVSRSLLGKHVGSTACIYSVKEVLGCKK